MIGEKERERDLVVASFQIDMNEAIVSFCLVQVKTTVKNGGKKIRWQ